jgi:hypothetical protein
VMKPNSAQRVPTTTYCAKPKREPNSKTFLHPSSSKRRHIESSEESFFS